MMLNPESPDLFRVQACHGEHANLGIRQSYQIEPVPLDGREAYISKYMVPWPRRVTLTKPIHQSFAH